MATYKKYNDFALYGLQAVNLSSDAINLALSNTLWSSETSDPTADTNSALANRTQIAYTNYTDDLTVDRVLTSGTLAHTLSGGTSTFDYGADIVITASGGAVATFQYIDLYDDTMTSPLDMLFVGWDHGSGITLASGESATLAFNASGIFTLT